MRKETITSGQNPKIKMLLALQEKSKTRRREGLFVVEGRRELEHCINAGFRVRTLFVCTEIISPEDWEYIYGKAGAEAGPSVIEVPAELYDKIAYRGGTEGVIAEIEYVERGLSSLKVKENPLVVVLESVEKPGNLGAVLRSADASLQPEPHTFEHRSDIHCSGCDSIVRRHDQMAERQQNKDIHGPAPGLRMVLRHRHVMRNCNSNGYRGDRADGHMEKGS